jgi:hypothetical protein
MTNMLGTTIPVSTVQLRTLSVGQTPRLSPVPITVSYMNNSDIVTDLRPVIFGVGWIGC